MKESWDLKHTNNINQMLRVKQNTQCKGELPILLIVRHRYHVADDIMFPDPSCLAFFSSFEENHLEQLEKLGGLELVAVDIFEGLMQFFIYCEDGQKSVYDCISFLKSNANYQVDFEIINDKQWSKYKQLNT